jgi:hypothetical protein
MSVKFFIHTYKVSALEQGHFTFLHLFMHWLDAAEARLCGNCDEPSGSISRSQVLAFVAPV